MMPYRIWIVLGALSGLMAVGAAAYGAHGAIEPSRVRALASAIQMQGWHALALLAVGLWGGHGGTLAHAAGIAFVTGTVLFCSAVYVPMFGGPGLGMTAPVGGMTLMLGWALLAASAVFARMG